MLFQISSALLDACVLGVLAQESAYGYILTRKVKEVVDVSESTLYPVLRRLLKEDLLESYDQPYDGRNRRYYRLTNQGGEQLCLYRQEWQEYKNNIDKLLLGGCEQ